MIPISWHICFLINLSVPGSSLLLAVNPHSFFFQLTYFSSKFSSTLGLAMILKRGVARILGNGGGLDEMCAGQFIMVFFACLTNNIWMDWILTILEYGDLTKVTTGLLISTIFVLKLSYSLFCTIGRSKNSARTIIDQPTLILLPIFTFFTFSKMKVGCGGKKDVRLKLSKSFSLINFAS